MGVSARLRIFSAIIFSMSAQISSADGISGTWRTEDGAEGGYVHVRIAPCGPARCGIIVHAVDETGTPNPDYEHMNRQILWDMTPDGSVWHGRVWAPDSDQTFRARMRPAGPTAELSGCVLGGLVCRSQTWTRVD